MSRTHVPLETALNQLLVETRLGKEKVAAAPAPVVNPVTSDLRKMASALRNVSDPSAVTYEDLNRVKEILHGRR